MLTVEIQVASIVIAIAVGVISKICYDWLVNRKGIDDSKTLEMSDSITVIKEAVTKSDSEGTPLIYNPREAIKLSREHNERSLETNFILKDIKELLQENSLAMRDLMREVRSLK